MKNEHTKKKLLLILDWMKKTDEQHPLNATQLAEMLEREGISAERKSISRDIACLRDCDYEIVSHPNHNLGWYMIGQEFEDHEIKLLADAVAAAKFLTVEDTRSIIKKLKNHATKECERLIDATLIMDPDLKVDDKSFNRKFDTIMKAIADRKQISFQYQELVAGNKKSLRRDGHVYEVNPYYIVLSGDEYFLICNPISHNHVTYFRIERITGLTVLDKPVRIMEEIDELKDIGNSTSIAEYLRNHINMWDGEVTGITLKARNEFRYDIMKKYGKNVSFKDDGDDSFTVRVNVPNNEGLYYWLAAYGPYIKIVAPEDVKNGYIDYLKRSLSLYE